MNRIKKCKKGFTLLEMVLSIGIIVIIGGVVLGLCASISNMFIATYDIEDTADYALLYATGFENSFIKYTRIPADSLADTFGSSRKLTWYVSDPVNDDTTIPTLCIDPDHSAVIPAFTPNNIGNANTPYKWCIRMFYKFDGDPSDMDAGNKSVSYRIFITENSDDSDFVYGYAGSFWLPRFKQIAEFEEVNGRSVTLSGLDMSEDTFKNVYNYSDTQYDCIKAIVEGTENQGFKSQITFNYGSPA